MRWGIYVNVYLYMFMYILYNVNIELFRTTPALFLGCVPVLTKELFSFNFFHEVRICIYIYMSMSMYVLYIYILICIYLFILMGAVFWLRASTNEGSFFVQLFLRGENMYIYIYVYVYVCIIYIYV